jgi:hypothetical protein
MLYNINLIIIIAILTMIIIVVAFTTIILIITSLSLFKGVFHYQYIKLGLSNKIKLGLSKNIKFSILKLSSICTTVSTVVNSTTVELVDSDLYPLLVDLILNQIGDSKEISFALLHSLGLSSTSVLQYLVHLGYTIIG